MQKTRFGNSIFTTIFFVSVYTTLLLTIYSFILNKSSYNIFEIGGTLPKQPNIYLNNSFLSSWIFYSNFGSQGSGLLYSIFYYGIVSLFHNVAIAERAWFILEFSISAISSYILALKSLNNKWVSFILSLAFSFSPVVTNMAISGAYMIYLLYAFTPLFMIIILKIIDSKFLLSLEYVILFALLSAFVFEFNPGYIMWTPVLFIIYSGLSVLLKNQTSSSLIANLAILVFFFLIMFFLTKTLNSLWDIFSGNSVSYFSTTDFGASSTNQILIDLETNFNGWLSFTYWYPAVISEFVIITFTIFQYNTNIINRSLTILSFSLGIQALLVLVTWGIFHFQIFILMRFIASYMPFLGEYIPHMGYVIVVAYLIIQSMIVLGGFNQISISRSKFTFKTKNNSIRINTKTLLISIFILLLLFITPINFHTNYPGDSSTLGMYNNSESFLINDKVPDNVNTISNWFNSNTAKNEGYRVMFFPFSMSTDNVILSSMKWTFMTNITNNAVPFLNPALSNHTKDLSDVLGESSVKYVVVYFGPFLGIDNKLFYSGPPRFYSSGYSWELSWIAAGAPYAWSHIFNSSKYFHLIANVGNALIYKNLEYKGTVFRYSIGNINESQLKSEMVNPISYNQDTLDLLFKTNLYTIISDYKSVNFSNNLVSLNLTNKTEVTANISPGNFSGLISYAYQRSSPDKYYRVSYNISGMNVNSVNLKINFYNKQGNIISCLNARNEPNIVLSTHGNFSAHNKLLFESPANTSYDEFMVDISHNGTNFRKNGYVSVSSIKIVNVSSFQPIKINYEYVHPWEIKLNGSVHGNQLIRFLTSYDPGWVYHSGNQSYNSIFIGLGYRSENAFLVNAGNTTNFDYISFTPQASYKMSLINWGMDWVISISILLPIDLYRRRISKKRSYEGGVTGEYIKF